MRFMFSLDGATEASWVERRQSRRRPTFLHCWIRLPGRAPVTCIVRNMSEGGALLEVPENTWLPSRFRLEIAAESFASDCEIRHQRDNSVGVCFLARPSTPFPRRGRT